MVNSFMLCRWMNALAQDIPSVATATIKDLKGASNLVANNKTDEERPVNGLINILKQPNKGKSDDEKDDKLKSPPVKYQWALIINLTHNNLIDNLINSF